MLPVKSNTLSCWTYCRKHESIFALFGISEHWYNKGCFTHWRRVTHICVCKLIIIGPDNGLLPGWCKGIIWTDAWILLIGTLGISFWEILIQMNMFSFKKMHLKISSAKCCLLCLGLNELNVSLFCIISIMVADHLVMLLVSPGHQKPWYWIVIIKYSGFSIAGVNAQRLKKLTQWPTLWRWHFEMYFVDHQFVLFIPPASTKLKGGILVSPCPSVRLSVCGQNGVRSVSSTILIGSISYLHILSSNFRRCVACNGCFKIKKLEICYFDFVFFWLGIRYDSMVWVIMRWRGYPQNAGILVVLVDSYFTSVCAQGPIWQLVSIGSGNDLAPNRCLNELSFK